jgi:hypothetical protein
MTSSILVVLDVSNSMNDAFGGLEELTKYKAVIEGFRGFFENASKKPRQYDCSNRTRFGMISYKTKVTGKAIFNEVYPLMSFPPVPDIDVLCEIKPSGDSPLFQALEKGIEILAREKSDNKTMILVTSDGISNCDPKSLQIEEIAAKIKAANIQISILQTGYAQKECFKVLVEKLKVVLVKKSSLEPKIAHSVRQIKEWLEASLPKNEA